MANEHMRMISDREEIPTWARTLRESIEELARRTSQAERAMPGGQRYRARGESVSATANMPGRRQPGIDRDLENGVDRLNTQGQRRTDATLRRQEAELQELRAMARRVLRQPSSEDRNATASAFQRADSVYAMLGAQTPPPMPGESSMAFRHRLADGLKRHSPTLARTNMDSLPDSAFNVVEQRVYQDAVTAARTGASATRGQLRPHAFKTETGHNTTEYFGDPLGWMAPFMATGHKLKINRNPGKAL